MATHYITLLSDSEDIIAEGASMKGVLLYTLKNHRLGNQGRRITLAEVEVTKQNPEKPYKMVGSLQIDSDSKFYKALLRVLK
jgi:hypothetical protein